MSMVFCRGCGKEIHDSAIACPNCGATQPVAQIQAVSYTERHAYTSYDQVPWYRKNWFTVLSILFFPPAILLQLLTGDVYYVRKGQLKMYSKISKAVIIVWSIAVIIAVVNK